MATADYYIRKDDTLPVIGSTLKYADGSIVDLTGGTYQLLITNADTGVTVTRTATLDGLAINGGLKYQWVAADSAAPGFYKARWVVTFGGSAPVTFPNNDDILIQVYDGSPGKIITNRDEYNSIRAYLGLDPVDFTDDAIQSLTFLQGAELVIRKAVNKMSGDTNGLVPTVTQIMTGISPAIDDDKLALKLAVASYVAYQFGPGATNAIDVSVTKKAGPIETTRDRGGIGIQWKDSMELAFAQAGMYLSLITGWPDQTQTVVMLSGPTSSGARPDTISGFWIR